MTAPFETFFEQQGDALAGPWRAPRQMLQAQTYDGHVSIHDEAMAGKLGFKGAPIEGPTHFTQFEPFGVKFWGDEWFRSGCVSSHYRAPVFEGEKVRAFARLQNNARRAEIWMQKEDGTEVLRGSLSVGRDAPPTALDERLKTLKPAENLDILADVKVGMTRPPVSVRMGFDQHMGDLYPFSMKDKLARVTEDCAYWRSPANPFGRQIIPFEMISVLVSHIGRNNPFPLRGKAVGLFADQEIRLFEGPLFLDEDYEIDREIVALSSSKRTESMWVRSNIRKPGSSPILASMLLNGASLRGSGAEV